MKKLLGILGTITITGSGMAGIVGNAPVSAKNNINYLQANILENLNRNKRQFDAGLGDHFAPAYLSDDIKNNNLGIIKNNYNSTIIQKLKEINLYSIIDEYKVYVSDKTNTSAKIVANRSFYNSNSNPVTVYYLIEDDLNNTNLLLNEWKENFYKWKNEFNRQIREDVPNFSNSQKRTWKDDKNFQLRSQIHSLNQNINIIMNNFYIKQLRNRVQNLENDLSNLKYKVETLSNADLSNCSNFSSLGSSVTSIVPVVGSISSAILGIISAGCTIANS